MATRNSSVRQRFLENRGLKRTPSGKEIDHKVPLADGGIESLRNLHLIKESRHQEKTAREARRRAR
jgi:5-methylcytosine-specific restriction endonuclease McrA